MGLDYKTHAEAKQNFKFSDRWTVFDGNKENFNIAYECIDRHPKEKEALRIKFDDGRTEIYTFAEMSRMTSQFAHLLTRKGIEKGDRVAVILNPSLEFYVTLFGTLKRGAVVVPCFPAFGPEAIEYRLTESGAKMVVASPEKASLISEGMVSQVIVADDLRELLQREDGEYKTDTSANSPAMMQFSSGTTGMPKIVPYNHEAATFTAVNVKLGVGLRSEDRHFCPSSPAWGHGIWYGSIGPLIFGNAIGSYSGKFKAETFLEALEEFGITNVSSTPLVYRMVVESGKIHNYKLQLRCLNFTGGPLDIDTILHFRDQMGVFPRSMFGTTEVGGLLIDYPYEDWQPKPGSMGGPMIGLEVEVLDEEGNVLPPGKIGQIAVRRREQWVRVGDAAYKDEDGYFWHKGRMDDIIISAGYTIGPLEIEAVLEKHPAVRRAVVVGSPDPERSEIVKAFIIADGTPGEELKQEIQEFIRTRLSKHEYPREIEFVEQFPETPDGKIKRKELREYERAKKEALLKDEKQKTY